MHLTNKVLCVLITLVLLIVLVGCGPTFCPTTCDDEDKTTKDVCGEDTGFKCLHEKLSCRNNQDCILDIPFCVDKFCTDKECVTNADCEKIIAFNKVVYLNEYGYDMGGHKAFCIDGFCNECIKDSDCPSITPYCIMVEIDKKMENIFINRTQEIFTSKDQEFKRFGLDPTGTLFGQGKKYKDSTCNECLTDKDCELGKKCYRGYSYCQNPSDVEPNQKTTTKKEEKSISEWWDESCEYGCGVMGNNQRWTYKEYQSCISSCKNY